MQRDVQLVMDEPIAFFAAKLAEGANGDLVEATPSTGSVPVLEDFGGNLKIHLIPEDRNKILIRVENLADLFDGASESTPYFNLRKYAEDLFTAANPAVTTPADIKITELALGGN